MQCPHCAARINKDRGLSVTCGKSECQEAEFKANQARNAPKKRKLKPKEGAKKADGSVWTNVPGGIQKLMSEIVSKLLPGDRTASVIPLTYGRARIVVGRTGSWTYDDGW